jgi:hypothetical protein
MQAADVDAKAIVDELIRDVEDSTYMGATWLVLTSTQKERLKARWQKIIEGAHVDRDWANY